MAGNSLALGETPTLNLTLQAKQSLAFRCPAQEILYGGAAGGGKSHLLRVEAIHWCQAVPGIQVYLFRRAYPDLIKNHLTGPTSFHALLAPLVQAGLARVVESKSKVYIGSSTVHLSHLGNTADLRKYQGSEIHVLLFDEGTHFSDEEYRFLRGRCRQTGIKIPERFAGRLPRIVIGTNPGGVGHIWCKQGFVNHGAFKIHKAEKKDGGMTRVFIPAKLEDNPILQESDPEYEDRLEGLGDPTLVRAMREGDWKIVAGAMFGETWRDEIHTCEPFPIPPDWPLWRGGDDGYAAPSAIFWFTRNPKDGRIYVIRELVKKKRLAPDLGKDILEIDRSIEMNDLKGGTFPNQMALKGYYDSSAFSDIGLGQESRGRQMNKLGCKWLPVPKSQTTRVNAVTNFHRLMKVPEGSHIKQAGIVFFRNCTYAIETIPALPRDAKKPEDVDTKADDHGWDGIRYGLQWEAKASSPGRKKVTGF